MTAVERTAYDVAASVMDPEMPLLTLDDLGVLRDVEVRHDGSVRVTITPTYSGCPAMATMRDDIAHKLEDHGYRNVEIVTSLTPAWRTDWISEVGLRKLRETGTRRLDLRPPAPPDRCR